jgi:PAS domain S-box-containing protein
MRGAKKQTEILDLTTLNQLPVATALFDNKKVYFLNKKAIKLFKISKAQEKHIEKLNIFKLLNPSFHSRIKKNNLLILKGEIFPSIELDFKDFKGNTVYLEINSNAVVLNGKKVIQSVFTEITERKKTEDLIKDTKEKFELITNNAHDIISFYTYYPEEKYLYVSPNIKKILGYSPEDLLKDCNFFNRKVTENKTDFLKIDKRLTKLQKKNIVENFNYTYKITKKNKESAWLENHLVPITDEKGKIRFFINVLRDVTNQKEKEIELKQQYDNYQNLLDNSQIAYLIHRQGSIIYCNRETLKILKLKDKKEILGKFAVDFLSIEDRKKAINRIKEIYKKRRLNEPAIYKLLDSKGNKIEAELKSNLITYNNDSCILTSIYNISEQRQIERERLKNEIVEKNNKALQKEIKERELAENKLIERTGRLTSILENTSHLIWSVNKEKQILSYNKNFYNTIHDKFKIKISEGMTVHSLIKKNQKEYSELWYPKYDRVFKGEKFEFEREDRDKDNNIVYRKIFINPIFNDKGKVIEVSCIAHDITAAKIYEQKLKAQSAKLNAIFESGSHIVWTINKKREITSCNKNYEDAIFKLHGVKPIIGKTLYSKETGIKQALDEYAVLWDKQYDIAFSGKSTEFITERNPENKGKVFRQIYLQPIFNQEGEVEEVSGIAHDITDKKISEQKLYNQAAKLNSIFDSSHHYIWTIDADQKLTSFNKNYFDLIASLYNTKPYVGLMLNRGILSNNKEYNELLKRHYLKAFNGEPTNFEIETLDKNYNKIYLDIFLNPIIENNKTIEVSGIAHDVTDKKTAQQRMEQSLKEKEVLLKEVHHRVKNNMQVISSILNLQSSYVSDEYTLALLKESQNRIKTMAYIHESLYQNKSFTSVNFSDYIYTLCSNIIHSYSVDQEKIELKLNLEKMNLSLDNSIPTGLIVNELITNTLKHAFKSQEKGRVTINLKSENNIVYLEVKDNGSGFDPNIDFKNTNSLGLQLVNTLVDQIDGKLIYKSEQGKGTEILISFKM